MRYTLFVQAAGVRSTLTNQFWATESNSGHVTDASLSARKRGIQPGMPMRTAKALIPELTTTKEVEGLPAGLNQVLSVVLECTPWIEVISKDSFYFQVPGDRPPLQEVRRLLSQVNRQLTEEQSIQVGLAESPKLARALVEWNKVERVPGALFWRVGRQLWLVSPSLGAVVTGKQYREPLEFHAATSTTEHFKSWIDELPIPAFWEAPPSVRDRLMSLGVYRMSELSAVPVSYLRRQFGEEALVWIESKNFLPERLRVNYPLQRFTKEWSADLGEEVSGEYISHIVAGLMRDLTEVLVSYGLGAQKIGLMWKSNQGTGSYERMTKKPVYQPRQMMAVVEPGLADCKADGLAFVELYAEDIHPLTTVQLSLSEERPKEKNKAAEILKLIRHVNRKYPDAVRIGVRPSFRELRLQAVLQAGGAGWSYSGPLQ